MRTSAILMLLSLTAPAWPAPPPTAVHKPATAQARQLPDGAVEADIRARFQRSPKIRADGFTVKVQGGVATIDGKTKIIQRKGAATRLAKLAGARIVDNRIQVDQAALEKAAFNLQKGRRRAQVKRGEVRSEATSAANTANR